MGAWRHAWDAGTGAPPTRERLAAERVLDTDAEADARRHLRHGTLPEDPGELRLVTALARERVARLDVPANRRPWIAWAVLLAFVGVAAIPVAIGGGLAVVAVLVPLVAVVAWPILRGPGRLRRASDLLERGEAELVTASVRPGAVHELGDATPARTLAVHVLYVAAIFGVTYGVRLLFGEDAVDALVGAGIFAIVLGPLMLVMGRRRYAAALRALAA